jgi:hypothetical protein
VKLLKIRSETRLLYAYLEISYTCYSLSADQAGGSRFMVGWNNNIALKLSHKINFSEVSIE